MMLESLYNIVRYGGCPQNDLYIDNKIVNFRGLMRCPHCQSHIGSKVIDTTHHKRGSVRRRRECKKCNNRFTTSERAILDTPIIIKEDGTQEEFNRDKLMRGLQIACVKRPVSLSELDTIIGEIESTIMKMGKSEISSRLIGDMVLTSLKEVDEIAYIRFSLVYLGMDDLGTIRNEIDRLIKN